VGDTARPSVSFERIADDYDRTRGGEPRGERYAMVLETLLDRSSPVLEVGIGTGLVALGLARKGFRVLGLDIAPAMARRAVERVGPRVAVGDARRMPFRDASVAQACSVWVLHVVGDVPAVLGEVARVLRPGGRYAVAPGLANAPEDEVGRRVQLLERELDPEWRRDDSVARLAELAPAAGLRVAELVPYFWQFPESPAEVAAKLERRALSFLWDVDDERWARVVVPVIDWLRGLPDPERPIVRSVNDHMVVLQRD
jgi:ubiquinone/menaquinone biosynthesis C-methylase UbiE